MAIWHFDLTLVPVTGLVKVFGEIPSLLPEYGAMTLDADLNSEFANYWEGIDIFQSVLPEAKTILSNEYASSDNEVKLGTKEGNRLSIWKDDFFFDFDLRNPDLEILEAFLRLARKLDCKLVVNHGHVIEPMMLPVLEAVKASGAYKFVRDPQQWLSHIASRSSES